MIFMITAIPYFRKKSDFSIKLFDLDVNRFYVKLCSDEVKEIRWLIGKKFFSVVKFSKIININQGTLYGWLKNCQFPLAALKKIYAKLNMDLKKMERNIVHLRSGKYPCNGGGNLSQPINIRFPLQFNAKLARIIAHLFGDGVVSTDKHGSITTSYYNQERVLLDQFIKDVQDSFAFNITQIRTNKGTQYVYLPSAIGLILQNIVGEFSSKSCRIPTFILNANFEIKCEFLKSFFDDEGYVKFKPPYRYIELALANKEFIQDIQSMLSELGIKTSRTYYKTIRDFPVWYFYIKNFHNLEKFNNLIGFSHPKKLASLVNIMKNPGRISYSQGETKERIVRLLKEKELTSIELAKELGRKRITINHFLRKLTKGRQIQYIKKEKDRYRTYKLI
tara:strand:+ start:8156 stop:9328 length:1173 start_codon:yes stop_codon:yes gene_type:complete